MRIPYILGLFFVCVFTLPVYVEAVQIILDTESNTQSHLDTFYVPVRIDTQDECINAVKVAIAYDPTHISVRDVSLGDSVVTLWTQFPIIERLDGKEIGRVVFEGGIPGGYCGRIEGDPGNTNILAKLVLSGAPQAIDFNEIKTTQIIVEPNTKVFLHDGMGSVASTTHLGVTLSLTHSTSSPKNIWLSDVNSDEIAPEDFEITLVTGPSEGNVRHYIVFNTKDKQSGIDHYEILETDPDKFGFLTWIQKEAHWVVGTSPFVLRDQTLRSKIMVKAVDKKGNERISTYTPTMSLMTELTQPNVLLPVLGVVILGSIVVLLFIRKRRKKQILEERNDIHYS